VQLGSREIHLLDYVRVLRKRAWLSAAVCAAVFVTGLFVTLRQTKIYKATARIEITNEHNTIVPFQNVVPSSAESYWGLAYYLQTQYRVISERPIAERAVKILAEKGQLGEDLEGADPGGVLIGMIVVEPIPDCHLVDVSVLHATPKHAEDYANAIVHAYVEESRDRRLKEIQNAVSWLSGQLKSYKDKKQAFEGQLLEFKRKNDIVNLEDRQSAATKKLRERLDKLNSAQSTAAELESEWKKLAQISKEQDRKVLATVLESEVLTALVQKVEELEQEKSRLAVDYTPKHPKMERIECERSAALKRIDDEVQRQVSARKTNYEIALAKEQALSREVDQAKDEALDVEQKLIEFNTMLSESETAERFYASLDQRFNEADITSLFQKDNIHIWTEARQPGVPIRPKVPVNLAIALAAGLLAGVGAAFFMEYLDRSVKGAEDVELATGVPFLGVIPREEAALDVFKHPRSHVAEACRAVRTNLLFSSPDKPPKSLLVTSAAPGEGKSTTVVNLGVVFAAGGSRTLLIDTDLRRPRLHQIFGVTNERGLTNLIVGDGTIDSLVLKTEVPGLFVLPSGPIPPNPAELLGSAAFKSVAKSLIAAFDKVIFDSPPVIAVTDPAVLSSSVDAVLLVARAGGTARDLLAATRRRLSDVRAPLLGVILNAPDEGAQGSAYPYYYSYYGENGNGDGNGNGHGKKNGNGKPAGEAPREDRPERSAK
jgi:polysaccharide biosynthesis transport protein